MSTARVVAAALLALAAELAPAADAAGGHRAAAPSLTVSPVVQVPASAQFTIPAVKVRAIPPKAAHPDAVRRYVAQRSWTSPVPSGRFTSGFGTRMHPVLEVVAPHRGIDLAASVGTSVLAAKDGVVTEVGGCQKGCEHPSLFVSGFYVVIDHGDQVVTTYNHLVDATTVHAGQRVMAGDVIGRVGLSGVTSGAHLHLQVLVDGEFVDPEGFLHTEGVPLR